MLNVGVVLSENSAPYQQFAEILQQSAKDSLAFTVYESISSIRPKHDIYIALGLKALDVLHDQKTPVIAGLVSSSDYHISTLDSEYLPRSAVFLDQPKPRQLRFLRAVLPDIRAVGILYTRSSLLELEKFRAAAIQQKLNMETNFVSSNEDIYGSIEALANDVDLVLATPDSSIFNGANIRNILLTTYRRGIPLFGFSQSYVNAGALAAIFSTPQQMAEEVIGMLGQFSRSGDLPAARYPVAFSIAINPQVANSLNIGLPDSKEIRQRMEGMEKLP